MVSRLIWSRPSITNNSPLVEDMIIYFWVCEIGELFLEAISFSYRIVVSQYFDHNGLVMCFEFFSLPKFIFIIRVFCFWIIDWKSTFHYFLIYQILHFWMKFNPSFTMLENENLISFTWFMIYYWTMHPFPRISLKRIN